MSQNQLSANDVDWFFDDTSDVHVSHEQQTCGGVTNCFRSANKLADASPNQIMFDDKLHKCMSLAEFVPFQEDLNGCETFYIINNPTK